MSDFYNPYEVRTSRKMHLCMYCAELINVGATYCYQSGNYDGRWYANKMHPECFDEAYSGDGMFTAYSNERPMVDA